MKTVLEAHTHCLMAVAMHSFHANKKTAAGEKKEEGAKDAAGVEDGGEEVS